MSNPIPDLLDPSSFASFKSKDESWFLGVAGDVVRDYCGWHIFPVVAMTKVLCPIGSQGIVMLPSLNVVSVEEVRWRGAVIPVEAYDVHDSGWLQLAWYCLAGGGFVDLRGSQVPLRSSQICWVEVDFTHGYDVMPRAVAEVGYELAGATMEKPAGVVSELTSGPYRFKFREFGSMLSEGQCSRLGPYAIERMS